MNDERRRDLRGSSHANRNYERWSAQAAARRRRQLEQIAYELGFSDDEPPAPEAPTHDRLWSYAAPPKPARRREE